MSKQVVIIAIALGILLFDGPRLYRSRQWGELATHALLTLMATVLLLLPTFQVEIPPLLKLVSLAIRPLGQALLRPLQP